MTLERNQNVVWHGGHVTAAERSELLGQLPKTLWLTGLSASGKSTLAFALERHLINTGRCSFVLDGDNVRHGLNRNLGFSPEDRSENIRRVAEVARLMNDAGLIVISSFISPYKSDRALAAEIIGEERFIEVFISAPISICEQRDPKGLYKKARNGEIRDFTGVDAPYEPPQNPALVLDTEHMDISACIGRLMDIALR